MNVCTLVMSVGKKCGECTGTNMLTKKKLR